MFDHPSLHLTNNRRHPRQVPATRQCWLLALLAVWLLFSVTTAFAEGGWARHSKVYVVPRTHPVVIDGQLNDWDVSGQILIYVQSETSEMQNAKFAMMYDADALYVSAVVRDPSPMMNRHDPKTLADKAWDADACQLRLSLDPKLGYPLNIGYGNVGDVENTDLIHLLFWYYTDGKEPCLQMRSSMKYKLPRPEWAPFGVVPKNLFQAAYRKDKDGKGYTFEYRIPWSTLGAKAALRGGDLVAGALQFQWGAPTGMSTSGVAGWAYDLMNGPGYTYQYTGQWGKVFFSEKGNLPKSLVEEGVPPEKPLPITFKYTLPEESEASVALFDQTGLCVRTLLASSRRNKGENIERWDGLDNAGNPLPAGKYSWKGVYHQPITTKFVLSASNSGQPPYATDDGTGGWGADHGPSQTACAIPDGMLLGWTGCELGWGIIRTDLTGKKRWGIKVDARHLACDGQRFYLADFLTTDGCYGVRVYDINDGRPLAFKNNLSILPPPAGGEGEANQPTGIAWRDGVLYVSFAKRNLIALYDSVQGTLKDTWSVPAPGRLAARPDGSLAVISEGKVVSMKDNQLTLFLSDHLDQPTSIAVAADGTLYVANAGALQNVSVFSATGQYAKSIGKTGGRPRVGRFDPTGMLEPGGMALDQLGKLWVAETLDSPKRQSVWDTQTGALAREFFGAANYFGWVYMDPKHPDELYCQNTLWKINLDTGACAPYSTIYRVTNPNMVDEIASSGYLGHLRVMTAKNGRQYAWGQGSGFGGHLFRRDGDVFNPVAGVIYVLHDATIFRHFPALADTKQFPDGIYLWQDLNDDQTIQGNEVTRIDTVRADYARGEAMFEYIDADLNVWNSSAQNNGNCSVFHPVRIEANGRPVYDPTKAETISVKSRNMTNTGSLWLDNQDDSLYTLTPGIDPGFAHWSRDGKLLWGYNGILQWNQSAHLSLVSPGKLHGLTTYLGMAGEFTGVASYFNPYHIFTRDGVYVAMVMRDARDGKGLGADVTGTETHAGELVKLPGTNRYFLVAGAADGRVTELFGLDTVKHLPGGEYTLTEEQAQAISKAQSEYARSIALNTRFDIVRGRPALATAKGAGNSVDGNRNFTVCAAYDDANLYLKYTVNSPYELINNVPDPKLLFKGGNCLDIQLATDAAADPKRKTPVPGDVRILVSRQQGKPLAVIYRPKVKGFTGQPTVFATANKETIDVIETTDRISLEYTKTEMGFTALVTIPREVIGLQLHPAQSVKLDVGYIFGNATGTQAAMRAYWINHGFAASMLNDVPTESRIEPNEWGTAIVE